MGHCGERGQFPDSENLGQWMGDGAVTMVDRNTYEKVKNERIRLVSKKLVEGISKREQRLLDAVNSQLGQMRLQEDSLELEQV